MLFSLIIPTYNAARTLNRCLDSLAKQTFQDFEIVIVDADSQDATASILQQYPQLTISYQSEPDNGIYDAINKGIRRAQGDYLCIVGADDALPAHSLQHVYLAMQKEYAPIYAGQALIIDEKWRAVSYVDRCDEGVLVGGIPFCHNAMFVSKAVYAEVGEYSTQYAIVSDAHWVHRAIKQGVSIQPVNQVLVDFYRGGTSSNSTDLMRESYAIVQENFPELTGKDTEYLFSMSKGWVGNEAVAPLLAKYAYNPLLEKAVLKAAAYAPHCAQRSVDRAAGKSLILSAKKHLQKRFQIFFKTPL